MAIAAKMYQDRLKGIKDNIYDAYVYFRKNRDYYNETRKFVLKTTLTPQIRSALGNLNRPELEFNSLEAYISRQLGEFAEQTPGIEASSKPSENAPDPREVSFVEDHIREILQGLNSYQIYRDTLTGGFSAMKVWTDYSDPHSFEQSIFLDRVYDPLLIGADPSAQKSHKGDGSYIYEMIPVPEEHFKELYPEVELSEVYTPEFEGFQWGYNTSRRKFIMICEYYEKRTRKVRIHRLSDNRSRTDDQYEDLKKQYAAENRIEAIPTIIESRVTEVPYVCRYRLSKDKVLEYKETQFSALPIIFVDGNSVLLKEGNANSKNEQITKAYVHNAIDLQKLKNVSGQTIANSIETMIQHKFKIAWESIPTGYEEAYKDPQNASNILYKAYKDDGVTPLPPPQEVMQLPLPPDVLNTFMNCDKLMQFALGSYDAALGINGNNLSGRAIIEGATQSNAAAKPFIVNYLESLQQAADIILDLIPKFYVTPRSIPIITKEGKRAHVSINNPKDPNSIKIRYTPSDLNISVVPGVNFEVQKNRALQMLEGLSQAFPSIAAMINEKGLPIIFDNLDIKGADQLKQMAEEWTTQQQIKAQSAQQMPNPLAMKFQLEQQKTMLKDQNEKTALEIKQQEVNIKQQSANLDDVMAQVKAINDRLDSVVQLKKNETERQVHGLNIAMQKEENDRKHMMDVAHHRHTVNVQAHQQAMDVMNAINQQQPSENTNDQETQ